MITPITVWNSKQAQAAADRCLGNEALSADLLNRFKEFSPIVWERLVSIEQPILRKIERHVLNALIAFPKRLQTGDAIADFIGERSINGPIVGLRDKGFISAAEPLVISESGRQAVRHDRALEEAKRIFESVLSMEMDATAQEAARPAEEPGGKPAQV